jgi:hypothetical protein
VSVPFDPNYRLIPVEAVLEGPRGSQRLQLVLDTGSTRTVIKPRILKTLGYDPDASSTSFSVSGVGTGSSPPAPGVVVDRLRALGHDRRDFMVVCHPVSTSTRADGLLGLDFLRGHVLTIDFVQNEIDLV